LASSAAQNMLFAVHEQTCSPCTGDGYFVQCHAEHVWRVYTWRCTGTLANEVDFWLRPVSFSLIAM